MRVLDLGCGIGYFLQWLSAQIRAKYYGMDLSLNSIRSAGQAGPTLRLVVGDAEVLPYKDERFDRITVNGAAHHFIDKRSAFHEMYRVLAPGGILVLYEPTSNRVTRALRMLFLRTVKYESPADLILKQDFTACEAKALLTEAGFTDISISFHDFLVYPLSGNYIASPLSRSRSIMELLWRVESKLAHCFPLKPVFDLFSWRLLAVSTKSEARVPA